MLTNTNLLNSDVTSYLLMQNVTPFTVKADEHLNIPIIHKNERKNS